MVGFEKLLTAALPDKVESSNLMVSGFNVKLPPAAKSAIKWLAISMVIAPPGTGSPAASITSVMPWKSNLSNVELITKSPLSFKRTVALGLLLSTVNANSTPIGLPNERASVVKSKSARL